MTPQRQTAADKLRYDFMTQGQTVLGQARLKGMKLIAVHHVHPKFCFVNGVRPGVPDIVSYARHIGRACSKSSSVKYLMGMIEPSFNLRSGVTSIQLGMHGVAAIEADDEQEAEVIARDAFWVEPEKSRGVYRPLRVNRLKQAKGGLRGALGYATKSLEEGGICRRSSYINSQGHQNTRNFALSKKEQVVPDMIFAKVMPHQQKVLYGIRCIKGTFAHLN